ncbi:MAG: DUF2911 domain-containing protein [Thermoanaerobaculia bacterium]
MRLSKSVTALAALVLAAGLAPAQEQKAPSPAGNAATQVAGTWSTPGKDGGGRYEGGKWIEISYSRPILRGRTNIFGKGADYGKQVNGGAPVWRAGANATTRIKTEVPLVFGDKTLPAGEYSLFVDLKEAAWTLIVSKQPYQRNYDPDEKVSTFGAYNYDSKFDVLRAPMKLLPQISVDQFTIGFVDMTQKGGKLGMVWEKTGAFIAFTVGP